MKTFLECLQQAAFAPGRGYRFSEITKNLDEVDVELLQKAADIYAEQSKSHNMFTEEEVKAAKATRDAIIKENIPELKSIYMAGEIVMWDEMQAKNIAPKPMLAVSCRICDVKFNDEYNLEAHMNFHHN